MPRAKKAIKDDPDAKKKVFDAICSFPGLFPHELERISKVKAKQLEEILQKFEDGHLVDIRIEDGKKQYFPVVAFGLEDKEILSLLGQQVPKKLIVLILDSPHLTIEDIEKHLKLPKAKILPFLNKFFKLGVIVLAKDSHKGNKTTYQIFDPERIRRMLLVDSRSFLDLFK